MNPHHTNKTLELQVKQCFVHILIWKKKKYNHIHKTKQKQIDNKAQTIKKTKQQQIITKTQTTKRTTKQTKHWKHTHIQTTKSKQNKQKQGRFRVRGGGLKGTVFSQKGAKSSNPPKNNFWHVWKQGSSRKSLLQPLTWFEKRSSWIQPKEERKEI